MPKQRAAAYRVSYDTPATLERWVLPEGETLPEKNAHHEAAQLLELILKAWVARVGRAALVGSNLAVRWDQEHPTVGVDPDVYLVEPPPPEGSDVESLLLWHTGHFPPRIAAEIVSSSNARKDYVEAPAKYATAGVRELWIFDPALEGPSVRGGPHVLQLYRRDARGRFTRVHAGNAPAFSRELGAWLVTTPDGKFLRVADDAQGRALWPTAEEAERAAKEAARDAEETARAAEEAARDAQATERAAKETALAAERSALARVSQLEAQLRRARARAAKKKPRKRS